MRSACRWTAMKLLDFELDAAAANGDTRRMVQLVAARFRIEPPERIAVFLNDGDLLEWSEIDIAAAGFAYVYARGGAYRVSKLLSLSAHYLAAEIY